MGTTGIYPLQPLAGQPDPPQVTPTVSPPVPSIQQQTVTNPYRMGQAGAGRKVTHAMPGVPAYPTTSPQQAPPTSLPPSLPTYTPAPVQQTSSAPIEMAASPAHQVVGVAPDSIRGVAKPLHHHWFYLRPSEHYWIPFSLTDSASLEQAWARAGTDYSCQVLACEPVLMISLRLFSGVCAY